MSNEEKILSMLTKLQSDITEIKKILVPKSQLEQSQPEQSQVEQTQPEQTKRQSDIFTELANLLDDEEKYALGLYQRMEEARKNALFDYTTWILPANPKSYDIDAAFRKLWVIEWLQTRSLKNIKLGDFAYIYESSPVKAIRWKCRVAIVNVKASEIDDSCFWRTAKISDGPFIWLERLCEYNVGDAFSYETLCKNGLKSTVRSPMKVTGQLLNYLETIDEMADRDERNKK